MDAEPVVEVSVLVALPDMPMLLPVTPSPVRPEVPEPIEPLPDELELAAELDLVDPPSVPGPDAAVFSRG